ncbi:protein arginine methyltransferase NDUFAF7 homolog, mitochondrial-like isoform X1 [Papaver somniferum]|uniref:protein arginine methyltransferase NDUFAF7 homolog, mitochondrial-like isoform X1 n=1 Tax=Papaver somniferum TaxID=3469 RepID=UPI000E6F467A|nr:protein arginine methyltransferase NDUFAF7 homolog, mitochondrial-like isoform X1 [Papaver somniferum]
MLRKLLISSSSSSSSVLSNGILRRAFPSLSSFSSSLSLSTSSYSSSPQTDTDPSSPNKDETEDTTILQPSLKISIDRSSLYTPPEHSHEPSSDSELVKHLKGIIKFRGGPISVAEYMEEVLTNPKAGFYINRDVFGSGGDFITSPEVSQMFGEMVGIWAMSLWEQMGQPEKVNLIELGPGRGTLMVDLLRGSSKFEKFMKSLNIHMVECSPTLKKLQYNALKCTEEVDTGSGDKTVVSMFGGAPVSWHATLEQVPSGLPTIIIGHEFYDALPVHQFQRASRGWCEKMVDVADDASFRFVLSQQPTPATLYLMKRCTWATKEDIAKLDQIEICLKGMDLTQTIAKRIGSDGGGALIIDYGSDGIVSDSLQAIRKHKFVDILDDPGSADLSAYVDFASIRNSAKEASEEVSVHGPMSQSQFLGFLGINFRVEALLQNCTDEQAESLRNGYWQLVGDGEAPFWEGPEDKTPIGMGTRYLAMAIVNKNQGSPVPFQ